ncbi:MAG: ankyrin repeat domain-containing protein [Thermoanaerobaculia bacterium]
MGGRCGLGDIETLEDLGTAHFYIQALAGIGQCFSPNPESPLKTDLPFEVREGELSNSQAGYEAWQSQMPLYMIDGYVENLSGLRGLRFDTAFDDEFTHIPMTSRAFSEALARQGIEHHFEMYNGDHRNRLWGRGGRINTEVLPYFSRLLSGDGVVGERAEAQPARTPPSPRVQAKLWKAAMSGGLELARQALDAGADVNALDTRTSQSGRRALNWAALNNRPAMIGLLVESGADVNLANKTGFTPLHHAAEAGSAEAARVLLELGADRKAENRFGHPPAVTAERHGHSDVASIVGAVAVAIRAVCSDPGVDFGSLVSFSNAGLFRTAGGAAELKIRWVAKGVLK